MGQGNTGIIRFPQESLLSKIDINSLFLADKCLIFQNVIWEPKFKFIVFSTCVQNIIVTARLSRCFLRGSLRSLETPRALSTLFIVFSPEKGENTMNQAIPRRKQRDRAEKATKLF